jgi:hypothetical protein
MGKECPNAKKAFLVGYGKGMNSFPSLGKVTCGIHAQDT